MILSKLGDLAGARATQKAAFFGNSQATLDRRGLLPQL